MNNHFLRVPKPKDLKVIWEEELLPNTLYIEFITPTRLQVQGKNQINIHLEDFIVNIIRRLRSLVYFHEGETLLHENLELQVLPLLEQVVVHEQKFHYVKYQRFSTRQKQRSFIDGVQGSMQLSEVPPIVTQLLLFGEQLHVGKQTVFGLGAYEIKVL